MEEIHRKSGSSTIDFMKNKVNRLVLGFFLKRRVKLDGFPLELSLLRRGVDIKQSSHSVKTASEDAVQTSPPFSLWETGCSSTCKAEPPPSGRRAQLVWAAVFVSCHLERESSHTRKTLWRPLFLFLFWLCVLNTKQMATLTELTISSSYWTSARE